MPIRLIDKSVGIDFKISHFVQISSLTIVFMDSINYNNPRKAL